MSEICREKTLIEELRELNVDEKIKKRLIDKCEVMMKRLDEDEICLQNNNHYTFLAENRINVLETTLANMCVKQFGKSAWQYDEEKKE